MNLRVTWIGKAGAALVRAPDRRRVRSARVGREVEHVPVAAGCQHDGVRVVPRDFTGLQIAHDDALGVAVHDNEVQHFGVRVGFHASVRNGSAKCRIRAEQKLLPSLAARVERPRNLRAAERAIVQQTAILARERHALRRALINDVRRHFGQTMDIGLARAKIAALDGVVEQAMHRIVVVLVILRRVDAALRRDRVRATGRIVENKIVNLVAQLGERGRGGRTRQPRADDDDFVFSLVGRVDQFGAELVFLPFLRQQAGRNVGVERGHLTWPPFPQLRQSRRRLRA